MKRVVAIIMSVALLIQPMALAEEGSIRVNQKDGLDHSYGSNSDNKFTKDIGIASNMLRVGGYRITVMDASNKPGNFTKEKCYKTDGDKCRNGSPYNRQPSGTESYSGIGKTVPYHYHYYDSNNNMVLADIEDGGYDSNKVCALVDQSYLMDGYKITSSEDRILSQSVDITLYKEGTSEYNDILSGADITGYYRNKLQSTSTEAEKPALYSWERLNTELLRAVVRRYYGDSDDADKLQNKNSTAIADYIVKNNSTTSVYGNSSAFVSIANDLSNGEAGIPSPIWLKGSTFESRGAELRGFLLGNKGPAASGYQGIEENIGNTSSGQNQTVYDNAGTINPLPGSEDSTVDYSMSKEKIWAKMMELTYEEIHELILTRSGGRVIVDPYSNVVDLHLAYMRNKTEWFYKAERGAEKEFAKVLAKGGISGFGTMSFTAYETYGNLLGYYYLESASTVLREYLHNAIKSVGYKDDYDLSSGSGGTIIAGYPEMDLLDGAGTFVYYGTYAHGVNSKGVWGKKDNTPDTTIEKHVIDASGRWTESVQKAEYMRSSVRADQVHVYALNVKYRPTIMKLYAERFDNGHWNSFISEFTDKYLSQDAVVSGYSNLYDWSKGHSLENISSTPSTIALADTEEEQKKPEYGFMNIITDIRDPSNKGLTKYAFSDIIGYCDVKSVTCKTEWMQIVSGAVAGEEKYAWKSTYDFEMNTGAKLDANKLSPDKQAIFMQYLLFGHYMDDEELEKSFNKQRGTTPESQRTLLHQIMSIDIETLELMLSLAGEDKQTAETSITYDSTLADTTGKIANLDITGLTDELVSKILDKIVEKKPGTTKIKTNILRALMIRAPGILTPVKESSGGISESIELQVDEEYGINYRTKTVVYSEFCNLGDRWPSLAVEIFDLDLLVETVTLFIPVTSDDKSGDARYKKNTDVNGCGAFYNGRPYETYSLKKPFYGTMQNFADSGLEDGWNKTAWSAFITAINLGDDMAGLKEPVIETNGSAIECYTSMKNLKNDRTQGYGMSIFYTGQGADVTEQLFPNFMPTLAETPVGDPDPGPAPDSDDNKDTVTIIKYYENLEGELCTVGRWGETSPYITFGSDDFVKVIDEVKRGVDFALVDAYTLNHTIKQGDYHLLKEGANGGFASYDTVKNRLSNEFGVVLREIKEGTVVPMGDSVQNTPAANRNRTLVLLLREGGVNINYFDLYLTQSKLAIAMDPYNTDPFGDGTNHSPFRERTTFRLARGRLDRHDEDGAAAYHLYGSGEYDDEGDEILRTCRPTLGLGLAQFRFALSQGTNSLKYTIGNVGSTNPFSATLLGSSTAVSGDMAPFSVLYSDFRYPHVVWRADDKPTIAKYAYDNRKNYGQMTSTKINNLKELKSTFSLSEDKKPDGSVRRPSTTQSNVARIPITNTIYLGASSILENYSEHNSCGDGHYITKFATATPVNGSNVRTYNLAILTYAGKAKAEASKAIIRTVNGSLSLPGSVTTSKDNTSIEVVGCGSIRFYPYIRMTYQTVANADRNIHDPVYVLSQHISELELSATAEVGWYNGNAGTSLNLTSAQWSTHKKALDGPKWARAGESTANKVLPGGAMYQLDTKNNETLIGIKTWQPFIPDSMRAALEDCLYAETEGLSLDIVNGLHDSFVADVIKNVESLRIQQWLNKDTSKERAWDEGGIKVPVDASNSDSKGKYYLQEDGEGDTNMANEGDLDVIKGTTTANRYYKVFASTNGDVYLAYGANLQALEKLNGDHTSETGATVARLFGREVTKIGDVPEALQRLSNSVATAFEEKTGGISLLVGGLLRGAGLDETASWAIEDGRWYNEAWDGIYYAEKLSVLTIGLHVPNKRTAVLDPKLCPESIGQADMFTKAYISQFKIDPISPVALERNERENYIGDFNGTSIYIPNLDLTFQSKKFYIPNVNVQDLR